MQQQQINIDLSKIENQKCTCGSEFFIKKHIVKFVPGIMIGRSKSEMVNVELLVCDTCGTPLVQPGALKPN